jgi:hypothetical protein
MEWSTLTVASAVYLAIFVLLMGSKPEWFQLNDPQDPSKNTMRCFGAFFAAGLGAVIVYHLVSTFRSD